MGRILVMGGSFNPPTIAHQRLLLGAVDAMNASLGLFVPSPHTYVKIKMRRAKHPDEVLSEQLRLDMLRAMAADDPRLSVDDCEYRRTEKGFTYETLESVQAGHPGAEVCFLAGADKLSIIPRWHRIREFLDRYHIAVVARDGDNPMAAIQENPFLWQHRDRFHIVPAPEGIDGISSSAVRDLLRAGGDPEALLHPAVWELLKENGGMKR